MTEFMPEPELDPKVRIIIQAREASAITWGDYATISGVSRETLYRWTKYLKPKDKLRLNIAYTLAVRLNRAVAEGLLPIEQKLKPKERRTYLRKIVAQMASK